MRTFAAKLCAMGLALGLLLELGGCATANNYYDPLEALNRPIYTITRHTDAYVLRPVVAVYHTRTPSAVQRGVRNFFSNLDDLYYGVIHLFNGRLRDAGSQTLRFLTNSTVGLLGLFDVATPAGVPRHKNDLGLLLGRWGVPSGAYLMIPFYGPTTLRDGTDLIGSTLLSPYVYVTDQAWSWGLGIGHAFETRVAAEDAIRLLDATHPPDEYTFVRNAYLQNRYGAIYDGHPPKPLELGEPVDLDKLLDE